MRKVSRRGACIFCKQIVALTFREYCSPCRAKLPTRSEPKYFGLTKEQVAEMHLLSKNCCQICMSPHKLCLDHNHTTGLVRGLICDKCNAGLGQFKDDPNVLRSAAAYLVERS